MLGTVRRLFDWLVRQGVLDRSPVHAQARRQTSQRIPFIFDLAAAQRLLTIAKSLPDNPRAPMRGATYHAVLAILYGLGLRIGEVCRLRLSNVDLDRRLLVIRETKFYKSRLVPFGPCMRTMIEEYLQARTRHAGSLPPDAPAFSFTIRGEIHPCTVSQTFHALVPRLQLQVPPGCSSPRLHDLRHSAARRIMPTEPRRSGSSGRLLCLLIGPSGPRRGIIRASFPLWTSTHSQKGEDTCLRTSCQTARPANASGRARSALTWTPSSPPSASWVTPGRPYETACGSWTTSAGGSDARV